MNTDNIINYIKNVYSENQGFIPLHAPYFGGNEKKYLLDTIDSTYVSSVGAFVTRFEEMMVKITGAKYAIATVNGTAALHLSLLLAGVKPQSEVLTQPLTFVATANAISHAGAIPVFIDVDLHTMGLSPNSLSEFLEKNCVVNDLGICINKSTGRQVTACLPMHTFGFPVEIDDIITICNAYHIPIVEDAAESLGSFYKGKHTGISGLLGSFSFNGNKIVTCGGGGAIVTNDEQIAIKAKHLSTTAKIPHSWEFMHDEIAYNYRMPNLNAALACAQLEQLDEFINSKRELAKLYAGFFRNTAVDFVEEGENAKANYWLNTIIFPDHESQQLFLTESNKQNVMTRPIWRLMNKLTMYEHCQRVDIPNAEWLEQRVVNIPSSVRNNRNKK